MAKKILIVDDDPGIIDVLSIILRGEGYEIRTIDDDTGLFDIVKDFGPDMILLDVWMPGMGGKEICRRLKSYDWSRNIPVIIVSASVSIDKVCKECGANGYINKPFEMEELIKEVKGYLSQAKDQ